MAQDRGQDHPQSQGPQETGQPRTEVPASVPSPRRQLISRRKFLVYGGLLGGGLLVGGLGVLGIRTFQSRPIEAPKPKDEDSAEAKPTQAPAVAVLPPPRQPVPSPRPSASPARTEAPVRPELPEDVVNDVIKTANKIKIMGVSVLGTDEVRQKQTVANATARYNLSADFVGSETAKADPLQRESVALRLRLLRESYENRPHYVTQLPPLKNTIVSPTIRVDYDGVAKPMTSQRLQLSGQLPLRDIKEVAASVTRAKAGEWDVDFIPMDQVETALRSAVDLSFIRQGTLVGKIDGNRWRATGIQNSDGSGVAIVAGPDGRFSVKITKAGYTPRPGEDPILRVPEYPVKDKPVPAASPRPSGSPSVVR